MEILSEEEYNKLPRKQKVEYQREVRKHNTEMGIRMVGLIAGMLSKHILQSRGYDVNYKINGMDISEIDRLGEFGIKDQLELAIKQERFEDAAVLRDRIKLLAEKIK